MMMQAIARRAVNVAGRRGATAAAAIAFRSNGAAVRSMAGRSYERTPGSVAPPGAADNSSATPATSSSPVASATAPSSSSFSFSSSSASEAELDALFANPQLQAALADPATRQLIQQLLKQPAQLATMLANPALKTMIAASGQSGRDLLKLIENPVELDKFMKFLTPDVIARIMQEADKRAKGKAKPTVAAKVAAKVTATPSPPRPSSPAAASPSSSVGAAALKSSLADPRFASMLSNPQFRSAMSDPTTRAAIDKMLADPSQLQSALSNPFARAMAEKMAPGISDVINSPEKMASLKEMMKPEAIDTVMNGINAKIKSEDEAKAKAAAAPSSSKAKPATTASSSTSSSSSSSSPPPPPPTTSTAAPEDVLSPNQRRAFSFSDLVLGIVAGVLAWQVGVFVLDHPEALDAVVSAAEEDELIQAKCGSPLKAGWTWSGSVNPTHASLVVPVSGPKGEAIVHARAFYDSHSKEWKMMLLQASVDGEAQKHTLLIPDKFVIKPRFVSPEEAERIRLKYQNMQQKMAEKHGQPMPQGGLPPFPTGAPANAPTTAPEAKK